MATAQQLWDIEQIKQLKARYFRHLDAREWAEFADLFTEDCRHVLSAKASPQALANRDYLRDLEVQLRDRVTVHHGLMPEITLLSETEAEGIWAMVNYVSSDSSAGQAQQLVFGQYFETYRKCADGRWRISSKRNLRHAIVPLPGVAEASDT